jgi:hypothetical protein
VSIDAGILYLFSINTQEGDYRKLTRKGRKMSDQLAPIDLTAQIRERVRQVLYAAIPDDALDALIRHEHDEFFKDNKDRYDNLVPSKFSQIVQSELRDGLKAFIKNWMDDNLHRKWDDDDLALKFVGPVVEKLVPVVQAEMARNSLYANDKSESVSRLRWSG